MIRVSVLYPNSEGSSFNVEYYKNVHMKLVEERLRDGRCLQSYVGTASGKEKPRQYQPR